MIILRASRLYKEVTFAYEIGMKMGFHNVYLHYNSANNKKPDLVIVLSGKKVFLELTALNISKPEEKINKIASTIANYILSKSNKTGYLISVFFDTYVFKQFEDKHGHIEEKKAISYLKQMIDLLHIDELIGIIGSLNFHDEKIQLIGNKFLFSTINEAVVYIDSEHDANKTVFESSNIQIYDSHKKIRKI